MLQPVGTSTVQICTEIDKQTNRSIYLISIEREYELIEVYTFLIYIYIHI